MKIHPRHVPCELASREIGRAICEAGVKYELTYGELVMILSQELSNQAKFMIRQEREDGSDD